LLQGCLDGYGTVFNCSGYKSFFLAFADDSKKKYKILKLHLIHKTIACVALALFILMISFGDVSAQGKFPLLKDDPKAPWHIIADEIHYDDTINQYIAKGNVTITKQGKNLSADYVRFDQKNMKAFATGHVIMTAGQDILTGSRMEMDLNAET
jgi:LPS-assembly protein